VAGTTSLEVSTVQQIYDAFFRGDLDGVMQRCTPEATISQDPALPWGGHYVGRAGIAEFATKLVGTIDSKVTHEAMFRAGDRVVQQGRTRGTVRRNGATFDIPECHIWTLREGLVAEVQFFIDSDAMLAVLGS